MPVRQIALLFLLTLIVAGCAGAPVQEMSDARQARQAAVAAGAPQHAAAVFEQAETALHHAEEALHIQDYDTAHEQAARAKDLYIEARVAALRARGSP
ncbi:MAG: DUF4398 domain-containing protein [Gammaproteobacteria bacterium]